MTNQPYKTLNIQVLNKVGTDLVVGLIDHEYRETPYDMKQGMLLYSHVCSNMGYALGDLITHREIRIKETFDTYGPFVVVLDGKTVFTCHTDPSPTNAP